MVLAARAVLTPAPRTTARMIEVTSLRKRYGGILALDDMIFTVSPGHVTGSAGPNGAGNPVTALRLSLPLGAVVGPAGD
jgi:ABC-2 type transport system ATP-binding protein